MPITFKRAGQEAVTLENVSFKGVVLDKVTFKRAGQEAVTVFEKAAVDALAGTWVFNDSLNISGDITWNINYTTNSEDYTDLRISLQALPSGTAPCMGTAAFPVLFYNMGSWDDRYKTITITSKLSEVTNGETLLAWLQANATKQS